MAELGAYYNSPRQKDMKVWRAMSSINLGFKFLLLKKSLSISLNLDDMMANTYWLQENSINGATEYSYDDERAIRISASYKFGNKNVKSIKQKSSVDEIQRGN